MRLSRAGALLILTSLAVAAGASCGSEGADETTPSLPDGAVMAPPPSPGPEASSPSPSPPSLEAGARWPLAKGDPCRGTPLPEDVVYVPPGMCARHIATGLTDARQLGFAPNGDLFVTNNYGDIMLLHDEDGDGMYAAAEIHPWATTAGIGANNAQVVSRYVYTGSPTGVRRFAYSSDTLSAGSGEDVVVGQPNDGSHRLHTVHVYDGFLYVQSGSFANTSPQSDVVLPDYDTKRALIKRFDLSRFVPSTPLSWDDGESFTVGLRNTVGFTRNETTKKMYGVVNGIDFLAYGGVQIDPDNPGEQLALLAPGAAYGFPFCFTAQRVFSSGDAGTPFPAGTQLMAMYSVHDDGWCAANSRPPLTFFQAHSAPIDIVFFDEQPRGGLPERYRGGAFVALHGSSYRPAPTGYKVVWVPFKPDGTSTMPTTTATGTAFPYEVVFGGGTSAGPVDGPWTVELDGGVYEKPVRPAGLAISPIDGALYISSDWVGNLFRIGLTP